MSSKEEFSEADFKFMEKEEFEELMEEGLSFSQLKKMEKKRQENATKLISAYSSKKYPALTETEWNTRVLKGDNQRKLDEMHIEAKRRIDEKMKAFSLKTPNPSQSPVEEVCLVMLGKTGDGKSAAANTVLGSRRFRTDLQSCSVTTTTCEASVAFGNAIIRVVDTPGLQDTDKKKEEILTEIARIPHHFSKGVHAFLYTINVSNHRFTVEDKEVLQDVKEQFGEKLMEHFIILMTHADGIPQFNLSHYVQSEKRSGSPFGSFLAEVGLNVVALDNTAATSYERSQNQTRILNCVFEMITQKKAKKKVELYTNILFQKAQKIKRDRKESSLSMELSSIVDKYLNENPGEIESKAVSDELLQIVKDTCDKGGYFADDTLRYKISQELLRYIREHQIITEEVKSGGWCTIL